MDPQFSFEDFLKTHRSYMFDASDYRRFTLGWLLNKPNMVRDTSRIFLVPIVFNIKIDSQKALILND